MSKKEPIKKEPLSKKDKILAGVAISLVILVFGLFSFDVKPNETTTSENITAEKEDVIENESTTELVESEESVAESMIVEEDVVYTAEQQILLDKLTRAFEISLGIEMSELTIFEEGFTDEIVVVEFSNVESNKVYTEMYSPKQQSLNELIELTAGNYDAGDEYKYTEYPVGESYYIIYDYMGKQYKAYSTPEIAEYPSSFRIDDLNDEDYRNNMR